MNFLAKKCIMSYIIEITDEKTVAVFWPELVGDLHIHKTAGFLKHAELPCNAFSSQNEKSYYF